MAEKKLTAQQVRFVEFYCSGMTAKDAYIKAGYKVKNDGVAYVMASRLLRNDKIQAYKKTLEDEQKAERQRQLNSFVESALIVKKEISDIDIFDDEKPLSNVQLRALELKFKNSQDTLDRGGYKAKDEVNHGGTIKIEMEYFDTPDDPEDNDDEE